MQRLGNRRVGFAAQRPAQDLLRSVWKSKARRIVQEDRRRRRPGMRECLVTIDADQVWSLVFPDRLSFAGVKVGVVAANASSPSLQVLRIRFVPELLQNFPDAVPAVRPDE